MDTYVRRDGAVGLASLHTRRYEDGSGAETRGRHGSLLPHQLCGERSRRARPQSKVSLQYGQGQKQSWPFHRLAPTTSPAPVPGSCSGRNRLARSCARAPAGPVRSPINQFVAQHSPKQHRAQGEDPDRIKMTYMPQVSRLHLVSACDRESLSSALCRSTRMQWFHPRFLHHYCRMLVCTRIADLPFRPRHKRVMRHSKTGSAPSASRDCDQQDRHWKDDRHGGVGSALDHERKLVASRRVLLARDCACALLLLDGFSAGPPDSPAKQS